MFRFVIPMSHSTYSPMEQGELEASPGYHNSPVMQHHDEDAEEDEGMSDSPIIVENQGER